MIRGDWEEEYCRQRENRNSPKQRKVGGWMGTFVKFKDQCSWMTVGKMRRKRSREPISRALDGFPEHSIWGSKGEEVKVGAT